MLKVKRINDVVVKPLKIESVPIDKIKGYNLFEEIYSNIFLLAKKKSGKTVAISKIIKDCSNKLTKVYIFASTVNKDGTWKSIIEYLNNKNIEVHYFTSLMEDGENQLDILMTKLEQEEQQVGKGKKDKIVEAKFKFIKVYESESESEEEEYKPRKIAPEYIIIFDDLSTELKNKSIPKLLKRNRHFKTKVIISNQYWNDLDKSARLQLDYVLLFPKIPIEKLKEVYKETDLSTSESDFIKMYDQATRSDKINEQSHNFLYVDIRNEKFRKNFNLLFV